jgi:hypothetical protein
MHANCVLKVSATSHRLGYVCTIQVIATQALQFSAAEVLHIGSATVVMLEHMHSVGLPSWHVE